MIDTHLEPEGLVINGQLESVYVYFRRGVKIREALQLTDSDVGRILVYVGRDGYPTAIQLVDHFDLSAQPKNTTPMSPQEAKQILFAIVCKMVAYVDAKRQRLGDLLIRDAVDAIRHLEPPTLA